MTCSESPNIAFELRDKSGKTYLKIRPRSMQFDRERGKFDYCKAEFSKEVADHIRPRMDNPRSFLRQPLPVYVILNDEPAYRLLWVPDGVRFTEKEVHIEFHDPQKYLTRGTVDWRDDNVRVKEAYEHVFAQRDTSGANVFDDIKFSIPGEFYENLRWKWDGGPVRFDFNEQELVETSEELWESASEDGRLSETEVINNYETQDLYEIVNGHAPVDFNKVTPWEAITELNEMFGLRTWAAPDGNFWVGDRNPTGYSHIATPDDRRVWKLTDYNVIEPRDPVIKSVARGGWSDDPSESYAEDSLTELESLNIGTDEFRIEGVATVGGDPLFGQEIFAEVDAKIDSVQEIAKRRLINKRREQNSGYLEIDPELSGESFTSIQHVTIGDTILTIPPESDKKDGSMCSTNIEKDLFDVVGVQHTLDGGSWSVKLDVVKQLDGELHPSNIETRIRYYDPSDKEYIEEEEYDAMEPPTPLADFISELFD